MTLSRRSFLKGLAAGTAGLLLPIGVLAEPERRFWPGYSLPPLQNVHGIGGMKYGEMPFGIRNAVVYRMQQYNREPDMIHVVSTLDGNYAHIPGIRSMEYNLAIDDGDVEAGLSSMVRSINGTITLETAGLQRALDDLDRKIKSLGLAAPQPLTRRDVLRPTILDPRSRHRS